MMNKENVPNLYRDIFPYTEVPYITFEEQITAMDIPEEIWITDTTFRDGQQSREPYSEKQILELYRLMSRLGGPKGIIRYSEFFLYSEKDRQAVRLCQEAGCSFPIITGWIRAVKSDFKLVKDMELKETGILTSASDYHIYLKLKIDRKQAMDKYIEVVDAALENGIIPRCHLEDITRADFNGFVRPFVEKLMARSAEAKMPIKIRACDTLGYGVPHPQATLPRSVPKIISFLKNECNVPSEWLEWHGHNDFYKVIVNGFYAWLYGASAVNGTFLGYGERTGNPSIEGLVIDYMSLKKTADGMDPVVINEIADYYRNELSENLPPSMPYVGSGFNTTSAGIHADGILKDQEIYNIFDTEKILKRPMGVAITDKSGTAGIAFWINQYLGREGDQKLDKNVPAITKMYEVIMEEYREGRTTSLSSAEMEHLTREYLPKYFNSEFEKLKKRAGQNAVHIVEELAARTGIRSMIVEEQEKVLERARDMHDFIQFLYVVDRKGFKVTRNIVNASCAEDFEKKDVGVLYSDRAWFSKPIETGVPFVSNFYISRITNKLCITVSAPIKNDDGKAIGVVGIDILFEDLART